MASLSHQILMMQHKPTTLIVECAVCCHSIASCQLLSDVPLTLLQECYQVTHVSSLEVAMYSTSYRHCADRVPDLKVLNGRALSHLIKLTVPLVLA